MFAYIFRYFYNMVTLPRSPLNVRLIVFQLIVLVLAPIWILKLAHYFSYPMPFLFQSSSLIPQQQYLKQTLYSLKNISLSHTFANVLLFSLFFLQHILMARLNFKIQCQNIWPNFPIYERLIYNFTSSLLILLVLEYQSPQKYYFFTLPLWICIPLTIMGLFFMIDSNLQMQGSLLLPYKFSQLFGIRQVQPISCDYKNVEDTGITIKGSYSMIRHPMQSGCMLLLTFGSSVFTFQKMVMLIFMFSFIFIGVRMEERRLLLKYKQYKDYMNTVKCRFIPFVV